MVKPHLILGPPGSGKTERALEHYRDAVARCGAENVLLLLPNEETVSDAKQRLIARGMTGALAPRIMQFYELVTGILRDNDEAEVTISEELKCWLLDDIVAQQCRNRTIRHFVAKGSDTPVPGLAASLATLISELKQSAIDPDRFRRAIQQTGGRPRNKEIAAVYSAYQERIRNAGLFDAEGKLWRVLVLIEKNRLGHLAPVRELIVDGFINFTPAQFNIVRSLAERVERTTITLTDQDPTEPARDGLFATTRETLDRIHDTLGNDLLVERLPNRPTDVAALDRLAGTLFSGHVVEDYSEPVSNAVSITSTPGGEAELEAMAREIKRRIVLENVPPNRIAVLTHSSDRDQQIKEVFDRFGIPTALRNSLPFGSFPLARTIACLLRVLQSNSSHEAILNLLKCAVPGSLQSEQKPSPDRIEQLCRMANVIGNPDQMLQGLRTLGRYHAQRAASKRAVLGEDPIAVSEIIARDCDGALRQLNRLFTEIERFPSRGHYEELADAFRELLTRLGVVPAPGATALADSEMATARESLLGLLREIPWLDRLTSEKKPRTLGRGAFFGRLEQALASLRVRPTRHRQAAVHLLPYTEARGRFFQHLYLPGMLETQIPMSPPPCPFFSDGERSRLRERGGIELKEKHALLDHEMFDFYLGVTRARAGIHFSYPYSDINGTVQTPSHYLTEIERMLTGPTTRPIRIQYPAASVFPALDRAARIEELHARVAKQVWTGSDRANTARLYNALSPSNPSGLRPLAERALISSRRDSSAAYDQWDGCLGDTQILKSLAERLTDKPISASRLESFVACPFAYFAKNILHLEPVPVPELEASPSQVGNLIHDIAFDFYRRLKTGAKGTVFYDDDLDSIQTQMEQVCETTIHKALAAGSVRAGGQWEVRRRLLIELLRRFVKAQAADRQTKGLGAEPSFFEVSFGFAVERDPQDPASTESPLEIMIGGITLKIHGSIDRIDLIDGGRQFRVIDYKSGAPPSTRSVEAAEKLQLPLYLLAAQQLLFADRPDIVPHSADFLPIRGSVEEMRKKIEPGARQKPAIQENNWEAIQLSLQEKLTAVVESIRSGRFHVAPLRSLNPCSYCSYRPICLFGESRHGRKTAPQPEK